MRPLRIACAAIAMSLGLGCSAELVQRPPAADPSHAASAEAPMRATPAYSADPLLAAPVDGSAPRPAQRYGCPMHPEVEQASPGRCPKCGMALEPKGGPR
jgi:hypothetical protein